MNKQIDIIINIHEITKWHTCTDYHVNMLVAEKKYAKAKLVL